MTGMPIQNQREQYGAFEPGPAVRPLEASYGYDADAAALAAARATFGITAGLNDPRRTTRVSRETRSAGQHHTYEDGGPYVAYDPALMGGWEGMTPLDREELEVRYNNPQKWRGRFDGGSTPGPFGGLMDSTVGDLVERKAGLYDEGFVDSEEPFRYVDDHDNRPPGGDYSVGPEGRSHMFDSEERDRHQRDQEEATGSFGGFDTSIGGRDPYDNERHVAARDEIAEDIYNRTHHGEDDHYDDEGSRESGTEHEGRVALNGPADMAAMGWGDQGGWAEEGGFGGEGPVDPFAPGAPPATEGMDGPLPPHVEQDWRTAPLPGAY